MSRRKPKAPAARPSPPPTPAAIEAGAPEAEGGTVTFPAGEAVPEWSAETLALFAELTALERAWVEWFVTCNNAIQAYRLATGRVNEDGVSRTNGWQIKCRPRVRAATASAMKDRGVGPMMDRDYKLMVIREQVEQARRSADPKARAGISRLLKLAADLQGEIVRRSQSDVTVTTDESPALKRMLAAIARAREVAGPAVRVKAEAVA